MKREINEIIISEKFSSLCLSEIDSGEDEAKATPTIRQRLLNTSELITRLITRMANRRPDEILPQNCRFLQPTSNGGRVVVIEDPPCVRTIRLDMSLEYNIEKLRKTGKLDYFGYTDEVLKQYRDGKRPYRVTLAFPYVVYIMSITKFFELYALRVFYRIHPITSIVDYLLIPNLLNIDHSFNVCLGEGSSYGDNTQSVCNKALNRFWNNSFNTDYLHAYKMYEDIGEVSDFLTWQYYSYKDPMFVFKVDWKHHARTLKEEITKVASLKRQSTYSRTLDFYKLAELFTEPIQTDEAKVYMDPCESISLGENLLSIGDKFELEGKTYWVNGFKGMPGYPPHTFILRDEEDQLTEKLLTEKMKDTLVKKLVKTNTIDSLELKNGLTIRAGDIVEMAYPMRSYRKVNEIRTAMDGNIEVKLGIDYYFADVLDLKIFNQKINLYGIEMEVGREYTLISRPSDILLYTGRPAELKGIDVNDRGLLSVRFKDRESSYEINETFETIESRYKLMDEDTSVHHPIFRVGPLMFTSINGDHRIMKGTGILYVGTRSNEFSFNADYAFENLVKDGEFNLPSYDIDLNFKIGDKVVFVDWNKPEDMTIIREIIGISIDENRIIKITARGKDDDIATINYADLGRGQVFIGKIRKIIEEYNGLIAGTKLRANVAGISKFPKKDVNQIIGFITDTGTDVPLMLCSNRCTLWAHEHYLSKFSYLAPSSRLWNQVQIAPPATRIAHQMGDFLMYTMSSRWSPYMLMKDGYGRLRKYPTAYMHRYITTGTVYPDERTIWWGLLQPRFTQRQLDRFSVKYVYPNMHGGYIEVPDRQGLRMVADWRCACSTSS